MPAIDDAAHRCSSPVKASTTRRRTSVAATTISGARAWRSTLGASHANVTRWASNGSAPSTGEGGDSVGHRRAGDVEDDVREEAEDHDEHQHRHPGDVLGEADVVDVGVVFELR